MIKEQRRLIRVEARIHTGSMLDTEEKSSRLVLTKKLQKFSSSMVHTGSVLEPGSKHPENYFLHEKLKRDLFVASDKFSLKGRITTESRIHECFRKKRKSSF
jgi:hypothetical protein